MWGDAGSKWETSVFSVQFCCQTKTALKNINPAGKTAGLPRFPSPPRTASLCVLMGAACPPPAGLLVEAGRPSSPALTTVAMSAAAPLSHGGYRRGSQLCAVSAASGQLGG